MADFLSRLVEHTIVLDPVVQPVIAPMFAPGPAQADTDAGRSLIEEAANAEIELSDPPGSEDLAVSTGSATISLSEKHFDSKANPMTERVPPEHTAYERVQSIISHRSLAPDASDSLTSAPPSVHPSLVSLPRRGSNSISPQLESAAMNSTVEKERSLRQSVAHVVSPHPQRPAGIEPRDTSGRTLPETPARPSIAVGKIRRQEQLPLQQLRTKPQERVSAPSAMPAIQVSIGRVEVRAMLPPAPVAPRSDSPPQPRPRLSLDDYLKQQRGGTR